MQTIGTTLGYMFVGRLSEIYGRRWVMIVFTLFGLVGCETTPYSSLNPAYFFFLAIVAGTSHDLNTFIGANVGFYSLLVNAAPNCFRSLWALQLAHSAAMRF